MLKIFKSQHASIVFVIPLLSVLVWGRTFWFPNETYVPLPVQMPAYQLLLSFIPNMLSSQILAWLLVTLQAFYLLYINVVYNFISQRTYLASLFFIFISSAFINLHYLHPAIVANIFILRMIVELLSSYKKTKIYKSTFLSGFLIGVAGLFYVNSIWLMLFIFIGIAVMHPFNWREWAVSILGFVVPNLWVAFFYFYTNHLNQYIDIYFETISHESEKLLFPIPYYIFTAYLLILGIWAVLKLSSTYSNKKISTRNYFTLFSVMFFMLVIAYFVVPFISIEVLTIMATPLSFLLANLYLSKGNKWVQEISFILFLIAFTSFYWFHLVDFNFFSF